MKVNCAAIPRELIESELFGHERGAFTGATGLKRGLFEVANAGTIFLDEIGDMDVGAQAKVLRVLQSGELMRVGGERPIKVDVRVLAATNRDLRAEVEVDQLEAVQRIHVAQALDQRDDLARRQAEFRLLAAGVLPVALADGGQARAQTDARPHAETFSLFQYQFQLAGLLDHQVHAVAELLAHQRQTHVLAVLVAVADDDRAFRHQ